MRYYIDGERVASSNVITTASNYELFSEQIGGASEAEGAPVKSEVMSIVVQESNGEKVTFKVKKDTPFSKVFQAFAAQKGVDLNSLRFTFDGDRLKDTSTPKMYEMEDGDIISVMTDQTGGSSEAEPIGEQPITIKVKSNTGDEVAFRVKKTTKLGKIFDAYASKLGTNVDQLRFQIDGSRINKDDTPKTLELDDNDTIDVFLETVGGSR